MTNHPSTRVALLLALAALTAGCPDDPNLVDAGTEPPVVDAGTPPPPPSCDSPEDCREQNFDGVCRAGVCNAQVPCFDDAECGLGETCVAGSCRFTGCVEDTDCAVGRCRTEVFACTECGTEADCPASAPVCTADGRCVRCVSDNDCSYPGPRYCEEESGACLHCLTDQHCPNGLTCGKSGICEGAQKNAFCEPGQIACDLGLMCVNVGNESKCLEACNLYTPQCQNGEICIKLTFQDSASLVFDQGAPLGVCYPPINGARGYHETCNDNCQPNLACVPDSASQKTCKAYCDPLNPFCANGEICHPWPGDYSGHQYGLCYPNNGYADPCTGDGDCKPGLSCVPRDDPSTSTELSTACAFNVGTSGTVGPCAKHQDCKSGACVADPIVGTASFYCFSACDEDQDCSVNGRPGYCDADYLFTTQYVLAPGQPVRGCRPGCAAPADCAGYGASSGAYTCRATLDGKSARFEQTCAPTQGSAVLGESCTKDTDCREGFCLARDGRGVNRQGICAHPCAGPTDCAAPVTSGGGTAPQTECVSVGAIATQGNDGTPNTGDDVYATTQLCGGESCSSNADCTGAYTVCTADVDPTLLGGALVTVCRAPSLSGSKIAGQSCFSDVECQSGVCAEIGSGPNRTCLQPCTTTASDCPGTTTCTANGVRVRRPNGTYQSFDACVP